MKRRILLLLVLLVLLVLLCSCGLQEPDFDIVATTAPVQQFAQAVCMGTGLEVGLVVSESVSCLHDYTLSVKQMAAVERAGTVILSGCGLEVFLEDALASKTDCIDSSVDAVLLCSHHHGHEEHHDHDHGEYDPHIWLDPDNAASMTKAIAAELAIRYPEYAEQFSENADVYCVRLSELKAEGQALLRDLTCRELITFHDGFAYLAHAFELEILASIEEDSGSEASAKDLKTITELVREHEIPAVFIEKNGSQSAASVIAAETGCAIGVLDMGMSGEDYFTAMEQNLQAIREALS